jgi:Bacterial Ig domain
MSRATRWPAWRRIVLLRAIGRRRTSRTRFRQLQLEFFESRCLLATVSLTPVADNTLYEDPAGGLSNGAGSAFYVGQAGSRAGIRRGLVKFDLTGQVPPGSHIDSVSLRLNLSKTRNNTQRSIEVHLATADWGEGTSDASSGGTGSGQGDGAQATANDATWIYRFYPDETRRWSNAGGDFVAAASATTGVGALGAYTWSSSQMAADVQSWLNTPGTQFGWLLKANDAGETAESSAKQFDTRESSNPPLLTINYSSGNAPPTLDPISDTTILEDAAQQTVDLTGISAGPGETQALSITATSTNTGLIPNPTVTYTSPNATGSLRFTPVANRSGTAQIAVTVRDAGPDGIPNNTDDASFSRTFTVTVDPVNDAPTLNVISNPAAIFEDAGQQTVNLSGIAAGPLETQVLAITATSSNPGLIPNPTVNYTSPSATGSLSYTPVANQSGSAVITVTVQDNGGTANGGIDTFTRTFTVTVTAVNDQPTLDIIGPAAILEDAPQQTVNLTGISAGPSEASQVVTIIATSNNTSLIPNPTITYTSQNPTGSLRYTPVANQSGSATITVTVSDNGGTLNGGISTLTRTFTVAVTAVNDAPTLNTIGNPAAILEDAGQQTVNLSGIAAGPLETQVLAVTATSSNPALIPNPTVSYTSANATGSLAYTPVANQSGSAVISVTVQDDGGTANSGVDTTTRTFTVTVTAVNDRPTLDTIGDPAAIPQNSGQQTVNLTGVSAGPLENQTITITATSNNTLLIPNPTVSYTSPSATGSLTYTPVANQSGSAIITVTVRDDGGTANSGIDTVTRTFTVQVTSLLRWHNTLHALDVTGQGGIPDGQVVAADAVAIINYINAFGSGMVPPGAAFGPPYYDTVITPPSQADFVAPNDALAVINWINAYGPGTPGPEGEATIGGEGEAAADSFFQALGQQPASAPPSIDETLALLLASSEADSARKTPNLKPAGG